MLGPGCGLTSLRTVENFEAATLAVGGGEALCTSPLNHLPLSVTLEWLNKHEHLSVAFGALSANKFQDQKMITDMLELSSTAVHDET